MTARATFESRCWEALVTHGRAIADGTPPRVADPVFVDALLRAADKYALGAPCPACTRRDAATKPLIAAVRSLAR